MRMILLPMHPFLGLWTRDSDNSAQWKMLDESIEQLARLSHGETRVFVLSENNAEVDIDARFAAQERIHRSVIELGGRLEGFLLVEAEAGSDEANELLLMTSRRSNVPLENTYILSADKDLLAAATKVKAHPSRVQSFSGNSVDAQNSAQYQDEFVRWVEPLLQ